MDDMEVFVRHSIVILAILALCVGTAGADEVWVDFGSHRSPSPTGVDITQSNASSLDLEFEVPGVRLESIETEGHTFTRLSIPGSGQIGIAGSPLMPAFRRFVEVPEKATVRVTTQVLDWAEVSLSDQGFSDVLYPVQKPLPKCDCEEARNWKFSFKEAAYAGVVKHELVGVEAPVRMRDHRMVRLTFSPVEYDAQAGSLRVATRVRVGLKFVGGDLDATMARRQRLSSRAFDAFIGRSTLNLTFADPGGSRLGEWQYPDNAPVEFLIITPPAFVGDLAPFVAWKTTCGFKVTVATTDTTGTTTTDIKAYLTNLYNGATPPVYILMIGDSPGVLATFTPSGGGAGGSDLLYVQIDGGDIYPDMMISRWPIDDSTQLINMRDKILFYEQPTAANSAWLNRALFLAGDDYENQNVTTHEDVIAELMDPAPNSAETDLWHGTDNPTTADLIADLNTGRAWAVYSAHSGPSGWSGDPPLSSSDIPGMANANMYPIGIGHSCSSNEWATNSDVFGEVSVTHADKGFVSYWGGSNSTHWVGDDWLQRGYFDALFDIDMTGSQIPDLDGQYSNVAICYAGLTSVSLQGGDDEGYYWPMYNLDGDPTLDPFTKQPTAINVGAPTAIGPMASDNFTVTVTDASSSGVVGALVAASQNGVLLGAGYTDGTGTAVFHIDAPAAGSPMLVRVTAHNHLPTDASVMVGAEADGTVSLNASVYPCSATAVIDVFDANATGPFSVTLRTSLANSTSVTMTDVGDVAGHFQGSAVLGTALNVSDGDTLSAVYDDQDTGSGSSQVKTATATIDCAGPVISNVQLVVSQDSLTVTYDTNEPGSTAIKYGTSKPPTTVVSSSTLVTSHTVVIEGLDACTTYFVSVISDDTLGNHSVDTNSGAYYEAQTAGWQAFLSEDFSSDPGWVIDNGGNAHGWAFGAPTGAGGDHGGPDPTAGFTGDSVYGVNLSGDYDNSLSNDQLKLTTPAIDCSVATSVSLNFRRWLGVEQPSYDHARVQVSVDGGSVWSTVWENTAAIEESTWTQQSIDLTTVAAGQSDVRIRWTQGSTDGSWQFCGWNIDDVRVEGEAPCGSSSVIFADGFEGGSCSQWSLEVP
jgi:hypothetical protein